MWDECQQRKLEGSKEPGLENLWWDMEEAKLTDKGQFNLLIARYEKDMRRRTALRYAVQKGLRWPIPRDNPNPKTVMGMGTHWTFATFRSPYCATPGPVRATAKPKAGLWIAEKKDSNPFIRLSSNLRGPSCILELLTIGHTI